MTPDADIERIDMLLALALAFGEAESSGDRDDEASDEDEAAEPAARATVPFELLDALNASEWQAVKRRAEWHARLTPVRQSEWVSHMLNRARGRAAQLDEHVHPSHIVQALMDEPARVQELVVKNLAAPLAAAVAQELNFNLRATRQERTTPPAPEIVSIIRRKFLSHFVIREDLREVTPLELLSGVELARLIRLLGVRETATACRGITAVEAVASFLRRFAPEDARAIATHVAALTEVAPRRVAFAEWLIQEALSVEPEPSAMLDRVGLRLLAITLAAGDDARLRYLAQKLPLEAARWLAEMAHAATANTEAREMMRTVARETEAVAAGVRRAPHFAASQP